jgi:Mg2+-importing ATPase
MIHEPHAGTALPAQFWQLPSDALFYKLDSNPNGLSQADAERRLAIFGNNRAEASRSQSILRKLGHRIMNPLIARLRSKPTSCVTARTSRCPSQHWSPATS